MTLTRQGAEENREMEGLGVHADALLSLSSPAAPPSSSSSRKAMAAEGVFECKTCRKLFPSFQALGGHRTSHTRLLSDPPAPAGERDGRARTHECAVCGLEFSMGQALGGHMRRHRGEAPPAVIESRQEEAMPDLNFPPLEDGGDGRRTDQEQPSSSSGDQPQLLNLLV
jgi:hypothetical protein